MPSAEFGAWISAVDAETRCAGGSSARADFCAWISVPIQKTDVQVSVYHYQI